MCTENQLNTILSAIGDLAKQTFGKKLHALVLYGSYARGDFDEQSDVDVMLLVDEKREALSSFREPFVRLCADLGLRYDLVIVATLQDTATFEQYRKVLPFYQNVEREGVKVAV